MTFNLNTAIVFAVRRWSVQFLLILSVVAQGGCLRACQLQRMMLGENDGGFRPSVVATALTDSTTACLQGTKHTGSKQSDGNSASCPHEFRKGLANPDRSGADLPAIVLDFLFSHPVVIGTPTPLLTGSHRCELPVVTSVSHSPPLLI